MYQFRFTFTDDNLDSIYSNDEIKKTFQTVMKRNSEILYLRVSELYTAILEQSSCSFLQSDLAIFPKDILSNFYKKMRQKVLYEAFKLCITEQNKFNIKNNIVEVLNGSCFLDCILGDYLLYYTYSLMREKAIKDEKLISKVENLEIFEKIIQM